MRIAIAMAGKSRWWCEGCNSFFFTTLYDGLCIHCKTERVETETKNRVAKLEKETKETVDRLERETRERVDKLEDRILKIKLQIQQEKTKQNEIMKELAIALAQLKSDKDLVLHQDELAKKDQVTDQLRKQLKTKKETFSDQYSEDEEGSTYNVKQKNQNTL